MDSKVQERKRSSILQKEDSRASGEETQSKRVKYEGLPSSEEEELGPLEVAGFNKEQPLRASSSTREGKQVSRREQSRSKDYISRRSVKYKSDDESDSRRREERSRKLRRDRDYEKPKSSGRHKEPLGGHSRGHGHGHEKTLGRSSAVPHRSGSGHHDHRSRGREVSDRPSHRPHHHKSSERDRKGKSDSLKQEEDLRNLIDKKSKKDNPLSDISSDSEEEGEMRDSKAASPSRFSDSSRDETTAQGMSDISEASDTLPQKSKSGNKESRWLSLSDAASDHNTDEEEVSDKLVQEPVKFSHRTIGGYGIQEEDLSSENEPETPPPDEILKEDLKELDDDDDDEEEELKLPEKPALSNYYPGIHGCRHVENYEWLNCINEGTYGVVYRAKDKRTDEVVALKKLKMEKEKEGFPVTSLREIICLLKAKHPNVVHVREIVVGSNMDKIYIVMDYIEHDLKALMETMKQPFLAGEVKTLMIQLLRGVHHLHDNWMLHRDLKTSNLLLSHQGILKIGDFGLAREYGSPLKAYSTNIITLWYRCPELLLGATKYSTAVDMWSVGCIFGELLLHKALFPGKSEIDQLQLLFKDLGTPNEKIWPDYPELPNVKKYDFRVEQPYNNLQKRLPLTMLTNSGFDLINKFLTYDPLKRISAENALKHDYFKETPLPVAPSMFPTWPAKSERMKNPKALKSPSAPKGGSGFSKMVSEDDESLTSFVMKTAQHGDASKGPGFTLKF